MIDRDAVELGGKVFVPTPDDEVVFAQRAYLQTAAQSAGLGQELVKAFEPVLDQVTAGGEMDRDTLNGAAWQIISRAMETDAYLRVIAGALVEEGKEWTRLDADANCEFFARLKGDDIQVLEEVLIAAIMGFFVSGLKSTLTSQRSSEVRERLEAAGIDPATVTMQPKTKPSPAGVGATGSSPA